MRSLVIGTRAIGPGHSCYIIAEAGVNHNGDPDLAHGLVDAAADAGAEAVKFQTFEAELLASASAPKAAYQQRDATSATQREMLARLALSAEAHAALKRHAEQRGITFMSSPFDEPSADLLARLGVASFKLPSGELVNHRLLAHVARFGRPLLVSTGMATLDEVREAVAVIRASGDPPLALFHCVSSYPAAAADANLRAMATLREAFRVPTGWSDHTEGVEIAVAAAALGAELLEKHLTLDRAQPGPDHAASLEPADFARMVRGVRAAEAALGSGEKVPVAAEREIARLARKSLHYRAALPAGRRLLEEHLISLRPGNGLPPARLAGLVGRRLVRDVAAGEMLRENDLE